MILRGCMSLAYESFAFGELKCLVSGHFLVLIYMYMNFEVLHAPLPKKILHLVSYKCLISRPFLKI